MLRRDGVAGRAPGEPAVHPGHEELAGPLRVGGPGLASPEDGERTDGHGVEAVLDADGLEDGVGQVGVAGAVEVHPVGVHHAGDLDVAHPPHVDDARAVAVGDLADPLVEDRHPAAHRAVDPAGTGVEDGEHDDVRAGRGESRDRVVVRPGEGVDVDARAEHVVAAAVDGDQVGLEGEGRVDLLGDDGAELAPADGEVGVAEVVGLLREHLGDAVGPAAQAIRSSGVGVADALGEGVAQCDVAVEGHPIIVPSGGLVTGLRPSSTSGVGGSVRPRPAGTNARVGRVLLSDRDIAAEIDAGGIALDPWDPQMMQPSSIDVRLDRYFRVFENHRYPHIDPAADQSELTREVEPQGDEPFILHPGEFVLGSTYEVVSLPDDVAARVEGKSSLGRLGLLTHATAGFVDPGFSGHVTLELANVATLPIKLYPGMKIGQLCFIRLSSPAENPYGSAAYGSHYQGQRGPTASRSFASFHRTQV